jgi:hypothetical protein
MRPAILVLLIGVLGAVFAVSCGDEDSPRRGETDEPSLNLVGLDGHEAAEAVVRYFGERSNIDCIYDWEASLDATGLDSNYPEASGLPDGAEPTPEIREAIRQAGRDPDFFEHWYVTATRAVFASVKLEQGPSPVPEVIQIVWLGFDAEGVPHWGADYGAAIAAC